MAIDPICGMTVAESSPLQAERDGQTYYFCSEHCRTKFNHQTEAMRSSSVEHSKHGGAGRHMHHDHGHRPEPLATVMPSAAAKYFCPMCAGVESEKPGDCPKCGMALERNPTWIAAASAKVIYTCPMHPEIQQDSPGDCPKCGMPLEPMTSTAATEDDDNAELRDMTRRLWIGGVLTLPVFVLAMAHLLTTARLLSRLQV
jgi:Cu+-exporting ATPase